MTDEAAAWRREKDHIELAYVFGLRENLDMTQDGRIARFEGGPT